MTDKPDSRGDATAGADDAAAARGGIGTATDRGPEQAAAPTGDATQASAATPSNAETGRRQAAKSDAELTQPLIPTTTKPAAPADAKQPGPAAQKPEPGAEAAADGAVGANEGAETAPDDAETLLTPKASAASSGAAAAPDGGGAADGAAVSDSGAAAGGFAPSGAEVAGDDADGPRRRGRLALIVAASVVVVLGIAYAVMYAVAGDSLARGATVAGIEVGGMTRAEAEATLNENLPPVVDQPIHLIADEGETSFEIVPSAAGLTVDVPATVAAVPGGSANPVSLVKALLGADAVTPVVDVDREALEANITQIAERADVEPVNGSVAFDAGAVVTSEPQPGRSVDVEATANRLEDVFFGDAAAELPVDDVPLVVNEVEPTVNADEVERAVSEFAEPAMSAPITVVAGEHSVDLEPEIFSQALTMSPGEDGALRPVLDGPKLAEAAADALAEIGQAGRDATITIENGAPVVVPAQTGLGIAPKALGAAVLPALTKSGEDRQAAVELTEVEPELTTEAAEKLGVTEVVSEFTTNFPHADYRNVNIGTAAERIDNTLLQPGEEFSLNEIVGERTEANGFTAGTIINEGRLEDSLGGGVSQVATTTFHAAFKAGLEDVEHWPHSIYFDRYPVGQEATVAWGAKDMRFANDTPHGVVVDTSFTPSSPGSDGVLTVRIWSTTHYRVETSVSDRYDYTDPRTIYDTSAECKAQNGSQGFSITSYRKVWTPDGKLVKDESDPWTYNPNHKVVCGPDPAKPKPKPNS